MRQKLRMLDLFAGLGGASAAMRARGWDVVTVDIDPDFGCTYTADLETWSYDGPSVDLVWASPPCTEFSRSHLPWLAGKYPPPSLDLARASLRIIGECNPIWWIVENVRGAARWLTPLFGHSPRQLGQAFLWGKFPHPGKVLVRPHKQCLSSKKRKERSMIPYEISLAIAVACESTFFVLQEEPSA